MRIGELLVERRKLRRADLDRVLGEQPPDRRLCSLLIARGLVEFDDAARALGEQHGTPAALSKHLAGRDVELAKLIPATLGRSSCALPLGRTSGGALIVAVRDPAPALLAALQAAAKTEILLAVAPAQRLEGLIDQAYGESPHGEFDVDFSSSVEVAPPPPPDMDALDPDSVRLALTDLDDVRVAKDPSQSGMFALPRAKTSPALGVNPSASISGPPGAMSLEVAKLSLERATSREAASDIAVAYIATRWAAGLVLLIRGAQAVGYRGHNVKLPENVTIALGQPSTLQRALEAKKPSIQMAQGAAQSGLKHALANAATPAAAPVLVKGLPAAAIVVGDPLGDPSDDGLADLGKLAELLGKSYERVLG